jgi:Ni/Fe-hydrogenase subunit HybB-like protein
MVFANSILQARDIVWYMEYFNLMAMFLFTVCMGFTAFVMAWAIIVLAFRGWAERRQLRAVPRY